jgi:hypothetical protein
MESLLDGTFLMLLAIFREKMHFTNLLEMTLELVLKSS